MFTGNASAPWTDAHARCATRSGFPDAFDRIGVFAGNRFKTPTGQSNRLAQVAVVEELLGEVPVDDGIFHAVLRSKMMASDEVDRLMNAFIKLRRTFGSSLITWRYARSTSCERG
jgi:hypothetical protein